MQRVNMERSMKESYVPTAVEDSQLYDLYKKVIQDQLQRERQVKIGQTKNPLLKPQGHTYTYGGASRQQPELYE